MKKVIYIILMSLLILVLLAKISNWFFRYAPETNDIINTAMYSLIGICYIIGAFTWNKTWIKSILLLSGIYLIVMNFVADFDIKSIIGIICMLTPILIGKFFLKADDDFDEEELIEN
ncbi:hypothetical protein [Psychroserpens sp. MEBiC05023]